MKTGRWYWRWLRFGGWFRLRTREDVASSWKRHFGWIGRFEIRLTRIALDIIKGAVVLIVLLRISLPLRPLAVSAPPADLVARYVPPPWEPMGDGTAHRIHMAFEDPEYLRRIPAEYHPESSDAYAAWEAFVSSNPISIESLATSRWDQVSDAATDQALDVLLVYANRFADVCSGESSRPLPVDDNPLLTFFVPWRPLLQVWRMDALRAMDRGAPESVIAALQRQLAVADYALRGPALVDWLVGVLMHRHLSALAMRLAEDSVPLSLGDRQSLEELLVPAGEGRRPSLAGAVRREFDYHNLPALKYIYRPDMRRDVLLTALGLQPIARLPWGVHIDMEDVVCKMLYGRGSPFGKLAILLGFSGWTGNDREGVLRTADNQSLWATILAGATLDADGPDLERLNRDAQDTLSPSWYVLRRGWLALSLQPDFSSFVERDVYVRADLVAARTALMLSAFRQAEGREAESLAEVEARFGWTAPLQPLTDRPVDYVRLPPPEGAVPGASAYALASWADGRAVPVGGGQVWLVVRNPAFGALPFRIYSWQSGKRSRTRVSRNVLELYEIEALDDRIRARGDDSPWPALPVPAGLFRADPAGWARAEADMQLLGWEP